VVGIGAAHGAFVIAALQPVSELARMLLLDAATFTAVALVGGQSLAAAKAAKTYLWLLILAVLCVGVVYTGRDFGWRDNGSTRSSANQAGSRVADGRFALKLALILFILVAQCR